VAYDEIDTRRARAYHPGMSFFGGRGPKKLAKGSLAALCFAIVFAAGIGIGLKYGDAAELTRGGSAFSDLRDIVTGGPARILGVGAKVPADISDDIDFAQFWDVWRDLRASYYEQPLDERELFYGAIRGMVAAAGDPYTTFFEPREAETFLDDLSGEFSGIGAEIGIRDGELQVIAPLPDSPAERAGVRAGDRILTIDGKESLAMSVEEAVMNIRGPKGTSVTLTLGRLNEAIEDGAQGILETLEIMIVRDTITVQSVSQREAEPGIYVIDLRSFNADTEEAFIAAVDEIRTKPGLKGLIVDLRNDPGGYLDTAVGIAGEWIERDVVVQQRERGEISAQYGAEGRGALKGVKTVVLVNEGSAQTFGKGSVQEYQEYDDGSALKVTVAEWLTPQGRSINHEGIVPDVEVELTVEDFNEGNDPQLDKALELIRTGQAKP
jgi:carboxyl-terminal processing protease